jgi:hypothetical protein
MCFLHTINIAVQHVLDKMSLVKAPESDDDDDAEDLTDAADRDEGQVLDKLLKMHVQRT